ncbi:hypothetical protein [Leifsonia sp. NPDC080035]|uniref:Protein kinase domain-containing protein n=1 Tax=Leifsonia sp. NPDC080035 TaxID=3143936 RepID=A0AAU7GDB6_9MICO
MSTGRRSRTPPPDWTKQARAAAGARRLRVLPEPTGALPRAGPREHSVLVAGDDLAEPALLRLRDEAAGGQPLAEECRARRAAGSEYVPTPLDEPSARVERGRTISSVLLPHARGGTLNALLAARVGIGSGEAATILLAMARALAHLHAAGWAGAVPSTEAVAFRADGCPLLVRMDTVRPWTAEIARDDRREYRAFVRAVCGAVGDGGGQALYLTVDAALDGGEWDAVVVAILNTAAPAAVMLPEGGGAGAGTPVPRPGDRSSVQRSGNQGRGVGALVEAAMAALDGRPLAGLLAAVTGWLRARPMLVLIGSAPIVVAVVVLVLMPAEAGPGSAG